MVSDLRPVFEQERRLIEQSINDILPEETSLLWMRQRTLWYDGHRYLRFSGDGRPQIGTRYIRQTDQRKKADGNYAERIARANSQSLNRLEKDAINFIRQTASQFSRCMPVWGRMDLMDTKVR
jgi:hypothetical protein